MTEAAPGTGPETDAQRLRRTQEFFGARADRWDAKFGDDGPAYAAAVLDAGIQAGSVVADVGCGTGRAFPHLRAAVGPGGQVCGIDATPQMLGVAARRGDGSRASLLRADALHLRLAARSVDTVFAAGLIMHLPGPAIGLTELARVTAHGGRLVLFHPTGRAALAARHQRQLRPGDTLARAVLEPLLTSTGWRLRSYDDAAHRFFALADREPGMLI